MSPFTDVQVAAAVKAWEPLYDDDEARDRLEDLHEAGIRLRFPEPRFYAVRASDAERPRWYVRDDTHASVVAWFYGPDSERHAREHMDRLNGGDR